MKAKVKLSNLVDRLQELRKEQSDYQQAISNLVDDDSRQGSTNVAVSSLRSCKSIVDDKIRKLENIFVSTDTDVDTLEGVVGIILEGDGLGG